MSLFNGMDTKYCGIIFLNGSQNNIFVNYKENVMKNIIILFFSFFIFSSANAHPHSFYEKITHTNYIDTLWILFFSITCIIVSIVCNNIRSNEK